jgi:hypothetical protein
MQAPVLDFHIVRWDLVRNEAATDYPSPGSPDLNNNYPQTARVRGPDFVRITQYRRGGALLLLVILPDGSRSLIPASWTDWHRHKQA